MPEVELGKRYRDTVTGVRGVATARLERLYSCTQINLEYGDNNGKPCNTYVDEPRLQPDPSDEIPLPGAYS